MPKYRSGCTCPNIDQVCTPCPNIDQVCTLFPNIELRLHVTAKFNSYNLVHSKVNVYVGIVYIVIHNAQMQELAFM